ncbi:MAG: hypothetical protein KGJ57_17570 [Sphingomonadales bacterium]|nr:hypothetical protein [Sphingomonadales bacterium]MDE2171208.1 hypothetical protein [Sphingomonadales bacterium]
MKPSIPFSQWLRTARAGDEFVYHTGHPVGGHHLRAVRQAYNMGVVTLAQRRAQHGFDYLAIMLAVPVRVPEDCQFDLSWARP